MPLEICKISRANRRKVCCDLLHAICSHEGVFKSFDLSPSSVPIYIINSNCLIVWF